MNRTSYRSVETAILRWAEARKIIPRSSPLAQSRKTNEEVGELLEAATKLAVLDKLKNHLPADVYESERATAMGEFKDAVGDVMVTLINACALADVDAIECLAEAYDEIKDRKGTLLPTGIFQKES